jgi:hypothetical protein
VIESHTELGPGKVVRNILGYCRRAVAVLGIRTMATSAIPGAGAARGKIERILDLHEVLVGEVNLGAEEDEERIVG